MTLNDFYEKDEVIHEVVEASRSVLSYKLIKKLVSESASYQKSRMLDVGCGDGSFIRQFQDKCQIFGLDRSKKAIEKVNELGLNGIKLNISSEKFPFENEYFEIVYMGDVIEHLLNPDFAIMEIKRVLKPEGFLILSTPNLACWYNRLLLLFGIQPMFTEVSSIGVFGRSGTLPVGHLRLFTLRALRAFLSFHGFKILREIGSPFDELPVFMRRLDRIFCKIPSISSIIIVLAQK